MSRADLLASMINNAVELVLFLLAKLAFIKVRVYHERGREVLSFSLSLQLLNP